MGEVAMKFKINGKERECELEIDASGNLVLSINKWQICMIDPGTRKLHLCGTVDAKDTGLKVTKTSERIKLGEAR